METDENSLHHIFDEQLHDGKKTLKERKINICKKENVNPKFHINNTLNLNNTPDNNQSDFYLQNMKYNPIQIQSLVENENNNKLYVLNDEVSLEGLYKQMDIINRDIYNGLDIDIKHTNENDLKDVYKTKSIIHHHFDGQTIKKNDNTEKNADTTPNVDNIAALFQALKNAQFNSIEIKSKIYKFIHSELYKIESKYLLKINQLKKHYENLLKAKDDIITTKLKDLEFEKTKFKNCIKKNVQIQLDEWKMQAKLEIDRFIQHEINNQHLHN